MNYTDNLRWSLIDEYWYSRYSLPYRLVNTLHAVTWIVFPAAKVFFDTFDAPLSDATLEICSVDIFDIGNHVDNLKQVNNITG